MMHMAHSKIHKSGEFTTFMENPGVFVYEALTNDPGELLGFADANPNDNTN